MNTPAHLVASALVLGRGRWQPHWLAITSGALMPDLPMIVFFVYEWFVLGTSQDESGAGGPHRWRIALIRANR